MLVIDSSITVAWFVPDERSSETQRTLDRVIEHGAVVPIHWRLEVGNALLMALRRRRITVPQRNEAFDLLLSLQLTTDDDTIDLAWIVSLDIAERFQLTLYDACYLELAKRRRLPLATLDRELCAAAQQIGVELVGP